MSRLSLQFSVNLKHFSNKIYIFRKSNCWFNLSMWRANSLEKTLMLGKIEGRRRRGQQRRDGWMTSLTRWTWVWASSGRWWRTGRPGLLQSMGQGVKHDWATEQEQNLLTVPSLWRWYSMVITGGTGESQKEIGYFQPPPRNLNLMDILTS